MVSSAVKRRRTDRLAGQLVGAACRAVGRSGLFYCNLAIISYYNIVGFVDGDRSIISEDRQHCYAHAEIRGQETVAEDGFELIVVGAGILDACHRLNWGKR